MINKMKNFAADESGAITVDWVVLTAATVVLGFIVITYLKPSIETKSENINTTLTSYEIKTSFQ